MNYIQQSLWVGLGAFLGANARYWFGVAARAAQQSFPWPTLAINACGSILLGLFAAYALERGAPSHYRLFFAVGLCGGFTTFSTFSFEVVELVLERSWRPAALYVLLSLVLCIGGCALGVHFGRGWFALPGESSPGELSQH